MLEQERPRSPSLTRFVRRGVARLAYETSGAGARTVVLVHDLLADRSTLHGLRNALVERGFRVIMPDLRGHGASAAIAGIRFTLAELVLDLAAVLEAEAAGRVSLAGIGLGATIGFDLAQAGRRGSSAWCWSSPCCPVSCAMTLTQRSAPSPRKRTVRY